MEGKKNGRVTIKSLSETFKKETEYLKEAVKHLENKLDNSNSRIERLEEQLAQKKEVTKMCDNTEKNCKICDNSFHVKEKLFKDFVNSPCTDFSMSSFYYSRPEPLPNTSLHVGNQFIHHSHKLHTYKGLVYCGRCGYRKGANQVRRLAKPCSPPGTNGMLNLEAIRKGELPPKLSAWPNEDNHSDGSSGGSLELYQLFYFTAARSIIG